MCFLPENFLFIPQSQSQCLKNAEYIDSESIQHFQKLAKQNDIWLSLGGFQEKLLNNEKIANTHIIIDNKGNVKQTYQKLHLFDMKINEKNQVKESNTFIYGKQIPQVIESPVGRLGLSICYDMRFPELFRVLSIKQKAQILVIPAAFFKKTGESHWHTLLKARAIENQCFVVAAAQCGLHNEKRSSYGHSLVINPWGDIILDMGGQFLGNGYVEIDLEQIEKIRQGLPAVQHIRNDVYDIIEK